MLPSKMVRCRITCFQPISLPAPAAPAYTTASQTPLTLPLHTAEISEVCRNSSRASTFERCTSTTGMSIATMASRKATEVCVYPPGVQDDALRPCPCLVQGIDQRPLVVGLRTAHLDIEIPGRASTSRSLISSNVRFPYISGSRFPSKFKLGPCKTSMAANSRLLKSSNQGFPLPHPPGPHQFSQVKQSG